MKQNNMKFTTSLAACLFLAASITSCKMQQNPLLSESALPFGAPQFDKIKTSDYLPAFQQAIASGKAEIDAIVANPDAPTFENTIEALEFSGADLDKVASIFYNLMEADTNEEMQQLAEQLSPMMTEYSLYISLNEKLFERIKAVWEQRESLNLAKDQQRLLEKTYKSFVRGGANLDPEQKSRYSALSEEISLLQLQFGKNLLAATNAFTLDLTDESQLAGLPQYVIDMGASTAAEKGKSGWVYDLTAPSYLPFMKFSTRRDLRETLYKAYRSRSVSGEFDNREVCAQIATKRIEVANLLGYKTYADYVLDDRMLGSVQKVREFMAELSEPSLPIARREVATVEAYARRNGFTETVFQPWDFTYWSEKYRAEAYDLSDEELKPYFRLEDCIDAVLGLATRLYGISFNERKDIPVYHKDVKVYEVSDSDGRHLALFYCDFFPRESKRGGAWMTEFRGQSIRNGVEMRPFISIVCNLSKPTASAPSLLTHDELTTFLHEFGHSLHGILAEGRYGSLTGTNVDHDFVELPSQIMENFAFQPEWLKTFARHYETGELISDELIAKIVAAKNYLSAYYQIGQLQYGTIDMAWHTLTEAPTVDAVEFERQAVSSLRTLPSVPGTCTSTSFSHIFKGGYAAGYYSYKWAEVLEADAWSLFEEKGIFNPEVSSALRREILSRGSSEDEAVMFRNFRGHDPQPSALLHKLGIK